jgi:decaprenylphospho-beta-D-erythro-pentofuranosid-2-ulose 2-reductase
LLGFLEESFGLTVPATKMRRVIILGALSTIAEALARQLAAEGASLVLAGRNQDRLAAVAADLQVRGAGNAVLWPIDLAASNSVASEMASMVERLGGSVDAVIVIFGTLGDQRQAETDVAELDRVIQVNFASAARWCVAAAGLLERQKHGTLLAISSVAGDRGRQSNYVYGAAKAGLTVLVQGLAHRLAPSGARAVVAKLGFVDTAMTAHIQKGGPLWAKPDRIARSLVHILDKPTQPVVYLPWFWRPIMGIIKIVPASIFHRTKL